jgi:hypothetical protein
MIYAIIAIVVDAGLLVTALFGIVKITMIQLSVLASPLLLLSLRYVDGNWSASQAVAISLLGMIAGYYAYLVLSRSSGYHSLRMMPTGPRRLSAPAVVTFVLAWSVYHFSVSGIPIFSHDVESRRFDFGSSGMFGLPSRMYLYGQLFAVLIAGAEAVCRGRRLSRDGWFATAVGLLLASRVISGFKSGFIQFDLYIVVFAVLLTGGIVIPRHLVRYIAAAILAVAFLFVVGSQYQSYQASGMSLRQNLERRVTSVSAEPVSLVLHRTDQDLGEHRSPIMLDVDYFANHYFHLGSSEPYGYTKLISAAWVGGSPLADRDYAPVTLSSAAVLYRQFGPAGGLAASVVVGGLLARFERNAMGAKSRPISFASYGCAAVAVMEFVSRGELVYSIINWGLTIIVLQVVGRGFLIVSRDPQPKAMVP